MYPVECFRVIFALSPPFFQKTAFHWTVPGLPASGTECFATRAVYFTANIFARIGLICLENHFAVWLGAECRPRVARNKCIDEISFESFGSCWITRQEFEYLGVFDACEALLLPSVAIFMDSKPCELGI